MWGWGSVRFGLIDRQLLPDECLPHDEDEHDLFQPVPTKIAGLGNLCVTQLACASHHNLALTTEGRVWA